MIIRKLVEHAFKRLWLLAIPIVVAPALVLYISSQQPERYVSTASVWASDPRGIDATLARQLLIAQQPGLSTAHGAA